MRFNATSAFDRYTDVAELLGEDTSGMDRVEAAEAAATAVDRLSADVGIEGGLSTLDIDDGDVKHIAERASTLQRLLAGNPRRVDQDSLETIIRRSL